MPSGEVFTGPLETQRRGPHPLHDPLEPARRRGRRASSSSSARAAWWRRAPSAARSTCKATLATDEGASRLGEIGIGTNFGIDRPVGAILFDEKIGGTVHLAVGRSYPETGGTQRVRGPLGHDLRPAPRRHAVRRRRADPARRPLPRVSRVLFITHPEVDADPAVPVPDWELTPRGRDRMRQFAEGPDARGRRARCGRAASARRPTRRRSSPSTLGLPARALEQLAENDRSTTGYLPPELFEPAVQAFFARAAAQPPRLGDRGRRAGADRRRARDRARALARRGRRRDRLPRRRRHAAALPPQGDARSTAPRTSPARATGTRSTATAARVLHGWRPLA